MVQSFLKPPQSPAVSEAVQLLEYAKASLSRVSSSSDKIQIEDAICSAERFITKAKEKLNL